MAESLLPGGFVNRVVRDGDTVRRNPGDRAEFVQNLLRHFGNAGGRALARLLGVDGQGREVADTVMWWQDRCWRGIDAGAHDVRNRCLAFASL